MNLKTFRDDRGGFLIPFEFENLPFIPQRVFLVADVPKNNIRGEHAHFNTQQFLICIKGQILVNLDFGFKKESHLLTQGQSIFIDKMVWDSQEFLTGHEIMCVLASTKYDTKDYIFDKDLFYNLKK